MNKYKALSILLAIAIALLAWGWHNSENNRLKLLEELRAAQDRITELENRK